MNDSRADLPKAVKQQTANLTDDDWITDDPTKGKTFEFAHAEINPADLLLPLTKIRSWASSKIGSRGSTADREADKLYRAIHDQYEFRVMELKPSAPGEQVRCALRHCTVEFVTLEQTLFNYTAYTPDDEIYTQRFVLSTDDYVTAVQYTALSYAWGTPDPDNNSRIDCEGHQLRITKSLETALKHFRQRQHAIMIWVDQICIDQQNDQEKGQQIPLMSSIYRLALNTAIWLGEADSGTVSAMQLLDKIKSLSRFNEAEIKPGDFEDLQLPPPRSRQWQDLRSLLGRQWFSRLWIIQEVVLSVEPWVLCGDTVVHWDMLYDACIRLTTSRLSHWLQRNFPAVDGGDASTNDRGDVCESIKDLADIRVDYKILPSGRNLLDLLVATRSAECGDARDKVYGLLGICGTRDWDAVHINYNENWTVAKLYHDMTAKLLRSGASLNKILTSVDHECLNLPSWVPNWRLPRKTAPLGISISMLNIYHASGDVPRDRKPGYDYTIGGQNNTELHIRGTLVGALSHISDQFSDPDLSYVNPSTSNKALLDAHEFVDSNLGQLSDSVHKGIFSTFWHTLVAGQDADGWRQCPEAFAEIFSLLLDNSTGRSPSLPGQTYSKRQMLPKGRGKLEMTHLASRRAGETFQEIRKVFRRVVKSRRLGIIGNELLGLFPRHCRSGDMLYVVHGSIVPFLLRPVKKRKGKFRLVGECYVHDIMQGEALDAQHDTMEDIVLV